MIVTVLMPGFPGALAMYFDGFFLGNERCVVVAMVIDTKGYKHLLDFEEAAARARRWCMGC